MSMSGHNTLGSVVRELTFTTLLVAGALLGSGCRGAVVPDSDYTTVDGGAEVHVVKITRDAGPSLDWALSLPDLPDCPASCDDGLLCTIDSCDVDFQCQHTPKGCPVGKACDPRNGNCVDPTTIPGNVDLLSAPADLAPVPDLTAPRDLAPPPAPRDLSTPADLSVPDMRAPPDLAIPRDLAPAADGRLGERDAR